MTILDLDPHTAAAGHLLALSDAYMASLYPSESNHMESAQALAADNVVFVGLYDGDLLAGCGAVKIMADDGVYGEIKRVFVLESQRGRGYSKQIMAHLEQVLGTRAVPLARLETGISQPEALALYRSLGYVPRAPFGRYAADPLSVFMEKQLAG